MAFAARPQANTSEENPVAAKDGAQRAAVKGGSLLQQGSKRRAPLGDMSNIAPAQQGRAATGKDGAKVAEATKPGRTAATRSTAKTTEAPNHEVARLQQTAPQINQPLARTRSQTMALARQQVTGPSMSSLLQSRSEQAVANPTPAVRNNTSAPAPPSPLPSIDSPSEAGNPLNATEYVNDIYAYFRRVESKYRVRGGYMSSQTDINEKMRAILVDWLVEVHLKFKLMPETLYLTVNLIDRFLEIKQVTRKNLQLVGVTAMLIASKYEEIWAPEVRDFVYISDRAYTREQILAMEKLMLNTLQFNLTLPTCHNFLARFQKAACSTSEQRKVLCLATYMAELSLVDAGMLSYNYSEISAAALHVALKALEFEDAYPHALARHSGYSKTRILPCAQALVKLMQKAPTHSLSAVYKKYCNAKQMEVATIAPPTDILQDQA